jgi:hypothetical protein
MTSPFIAAIETRLRQAGYDVSLNVELPAAAESGAWHGYVPVRAALVAARFYFCWKCFSYVSQNIFVAELPDAGAAQLDNLSAAGAAFSRQKHSPLSYLTAEEKSWSRMGPGGTAQRIKARGSYIQAAADHADVSFAGRYRCRQRDPLLLPRPRRLGRRRSFRDAFSGVAIHRACGRSRGNDGVMER